MSAHLGVMALCALCVSFVFGVLQRDEPAAQVSFSVRVFAGLMGGGLVLGLLQYVFFR